MIQTMKPRTTTRTLIKRMKTKHFEETERRLEKRRVANDLREMHNWIAVFEEEYDLPEEVVNELRARLGIIGERLKKL